MYIWLHNFGNFKSLKLNLVQEFFQAIFFKLYVMEIFRLKFKMFMLGTILEMLIPQSSRWRSIKSCQSWGTENLNRMKLSMYG